MLRYLYKQLLSIQFLKSTVLIGLVFALFSSAASARVHQYETARLKSTAGAGVASILMDEATILNPAPIAFFRVSSIYYQNTKSTFTPTDKSISSFKSDHTGIIVSDANNNMSGSVAYLSQNEEATDRKALSIALASAIDKNSTFGITYRKITDHLDTNSSTAAESKKVQMVFGVAHVINPLFSMGMILIDPFNAIPEDKKIVVGTQYIYKNFISIMFDVGANYQQDLSSSLLYRGALQFKILADFFLRAGAFEDKGLGEKGNGIGVGWVSPRFVIDFAFKNTKVMENMALSRTSSSIKDSSFSLSFRF